MLSLTLVEASAPVPPELPCRALETPQGHSGSPPRCGPAGGTGTTKREKVARAVASGAFWGAGVPEWRLWGADVFGIFEPLIEGLGAGAGCSCMLTRLCPCPQDYDLCINCYNTKSHTHKMVKWGWA